jgi:peptidoglycan DL-endopeptidase CwlO
MCSDERQPGNCSKCTRNMFLSARTRQLLHLHCGTVRPVLGQAHMPRRRVLPAIAVVLAVMLLPAIGWASEPHGLSALRARDAAIEAKSRSAVLSLYSLDQRVALGDARLAALRRQANALVAQRALVSRELTVARQGTRIGERRLAVRIRQLYEQGSVEPLEILLGAKSLDEALTSIDNLDRISGENEDLLRQLQSARTRLTAAAKALSTKQSALAAATRDAAATAAALHDARDRRAAYIAGLARERQMTSSRISALDAQAHAATLRSRTITSAPVESVALSTVPAAIPGGRTLTVSATGYSLPGSTASGLPVGWGVVAVDPSVIPLGTHMTVPGYGEAVAADTGSGVIGNTIDLWFPTIAQADAWGRRTVTIVLH